MAQIRIDGVGKRFGEVPVLQDIHLTVDDGAFCVLVGPSGSGKSTLLRIIAGLEEASDGIVQFDGVRVDPLPPGRRNVAMVFQSYALYPHLSIRDNLAFGLRRRGSDSRTVAERIDEVARMLQIVDLLDRKPRQLSGGQQQRVAIGRAIARRADVFLFDEPLSNLDAGLRAEMRVELQELHRRLGATFVYVTHDQVEAMTLADQMVVLDQGMIAQIGAPLDVYRRPDNLVVAQFIGSPKMNVLGARIEAVVDGELRARLPDAGPDTGPGIGPGIGIVTVGGGQRPVEPGTSVRLGVRAEDLSLTDGSAAIRGPVVAVERIGSATFVHVQVHAGETLVAAASADARVNLGEQVGLQVSPECCHVFDAEGRAVHPVTR